METSPFQGCPHAIEVNFSPTTPPDALVPEYSVTATLRTNVGDINLSGQAHVELPTRQGPCWGRASAESIIGPRQQRAQSTNGVNIEFDCSNCGIIFGGTASSPQGT